MEPTASIDKECPLCSSAGASMVLEAKACGRSRPFFQCEFCDLLYVPARFHVDSDEEKKQYGLHNNDLRNPGYVEHLSVMARTLNGRAPRGVVLDYGSGPVPAFAELLRADGWQVDIYDPYFSSDLSGLAQSYQLMTCIEVVEHFCSPRRSWEKMLGWLAPGGDLLVMTQLRDFAPELKGWHYIRDITHVAFYSRNCLRWIAKSWGLDVEFPNSQIACFKKRLSRSG